MSRVLFWNKNFQERFLSYISYQEMRHFSILNFKGCNYFIFVTICRLNVILFWISLQNFSFWSGNEALRNALFWIALKALVQYNFKSDPKSGQEVYALQVFVFLSDATFPNSKFQKLQLFYLRHYRLNVILFWISLQNFSFWSGNEALEILYFELPSRH